jgi:hypothetical protein
VYRIFGRFLVTVARSRLPNLYKEAKKVNHDHQQRGMIGRHGLLMLICCLIPIIAIGAVRLFDIPLKGVLYVGLLLLCPLSHVLMMGGLLRRRHGSANDDNVIEGEIVSRPSEPAE